MAAQKDPKPPSPTGRRGTDLSTGAAVDAFLAEAERYAPLASGGGGRLIFALDATMSRQPTWDLACSLQAGMFETAAKLGGLIVQLVYFRGYGECRASSWLSDPRALTKLMTRIACRGGLTQILRVLRHARKEAGSSPVAALVYVGDSMEERVDELCEAAGELGLVGVKAFMFQEGADPAASAAFAEIARLTGGAHVSFDAAAPQSLAALLKAAAAYASGGLVGLQRLADTDAGARRLLTAMGERR